MKILWMTWKDCSHPQAGGAELVNEELAKRAVADGHEVIFIVGGYKGSEQEGTHDNGYKIIRLGNRWTVYWKTYRYYKKHLVGWADVVIDEVNTVPYFAKYYVKERNILFVHQLCRQIWFYQIIFPLSLIGYLIEPVYLRMLSDKKVITVSESTKNDLMSYGFNKESVDIISEGITIESLPRLPRANSKFEHFTLLSLGSVRPMKRTIDQINAFEVAKMELSDLRLIIAGHYSGRYGKKVAKAIRASKYANDIELSGYINEREKIELLKRSHLLLQTSIKEGWGLTVTEAAALGTPAAVYNSDGLRDSVDGGKTGTITKQNNPQQLAKNVVTVLGDQRLYAKIRKAAWVWSKEISFNKGYRQFEESVSG